VFKIQTNFNYIQHPKEAATGKLNIVNLWKDNVNVEFGLLQKNLPKWL
jgi:4-hydroxythreonine-4-phosphate dehydrogenase